MVTIAPESLTAGLLVAGAVILAVSIAQTRRLLPLIKRRPCRPIWGVLLGLMVAFALAYLAAAALLSRGLTGPFIALSGVTCCLGALFTLLVARVGHTALADLRSETSDLEHRLQGKESALHDLRESESAVADANARMAELYAELEDLHERALVATQAKSEFLTRMSHELRTPLHAILGFAELIARGRSTPAEDREHTQIIVRSGTQLLQMINDVLDISKIESGRATLERARVDLDELLRATGELFRVRAEEKQLEFELIREDGLPRFVLADGQKLRQVLINLIGNAIKFTARGRVSIRARPRDEQEGRLRICFEVADTGEGIDGTELDRLFDPFTQTESGRRAQTGSGLGLAISRQFVELMGGALTVESERGVGTRFAFEIDFERTTAPTSAATDAREIAGLAPGQPRYRVLIAEDHRVNRLLLIRLLRPLGFELREAADGQEAVELAREWSPHVIFMDIRMPVMDGYEATRRIKSALAEPPVIIALTAGVFEHERARIDASGCDGLLSKPVRARALLDMLGERLGITWTYGPPRRDEEDVRDAAG
ncbi:MAG: response regulator [Myxococcales bacterium]|nr:response regulator [Myxococcales bacterium]